MTLADTISQGRVAGARVIDLVPYGRLAREALAARIAAEKARDPLVPVTVIVPSNYAGLSVRRALAATLPVVNVHFMVAARLAEILGAPTLAAEARSPLTPWVRFQAVRAVLSEEPGVFSAVAGHPATARELQRVFAELREVTPAAKQRLARTSPRAADVIRLYERYRVLTSGFFDEIDLMDAAARAVANPAAAETIGAGILYLPRKLAPALQRFLAAASAQGIGVHAVLGLTGDAAVDAVTTALAERLPDARDATRVEPGPPAAHRIVSATDAEEEVREAIRQAMALLAAGTPLHRIAITFGSQENYAALLDDALTSAGLPHNGPPNRTLARTVAGQTLFGLPRIASANGPGDPGYAREVVMDWLTAAPIHRDGREVPSHRWDEISREAGVVKGAGQWESRLELHAAGQEERASALGIQGESSYSRNARWARSLKAFIAGLHDELGADAKMPAAAHASQGLLWLDAYLPENALEDEVQLDARERVKRQLEEVAALGATLPSAVDLPMTRTAFAVALEEALSVPFGRIGKLGEGIFIGPLSLVGEMEFEAVIVLGLVERILPSGSRDDPILTTEERDAAGGELPPGGLLPTDQRRAYMAALLAAPIRILSMPRGDLRAQRATQPSRWLLQAASNLSGSPVYAAGLEKLLAAPPPWFRVVNSFESALRGPGERASLQEWDLASLFGYRGRLPGHFLLQGAEANPLARGVAARQSRHRRGGGRLDGWSGRVPQGAAPVPGPERAISPTALETFAKCPFKYFLGHILRVGEVERPEEVVTIEPAAIGNIMHATLERFFNHTKDRPEPEADWSPAERAALRDFAFAEFADAERRGVTGKALTWQAEQARLLRDLDLLLAEELKERRQGHLRFREAEAAFGMGSGHPPAGLQLANGGTLLFRGKADRIDAGVDGRLVITDYKTGRSSTYKDLKPENPLAGGQFLQLPVYALAFREDSAPPVTASYWFISESSAFERKPVVLDDRTYANLSGVVTTLVETMSNGYFPAVPGSETRPYGVPWENCRYCPYDAVCPSANRTEIWAEVKGDPGLAAFAGLADGESAAVEETDA
ncbi:MAG: PD-(D/E)XK nuclease family protein [Dehalococcoidia bacterium]|nr:PD-(D/E)XK nuclease family protein [Dehalococcoidia bacterium]